MSECNQQDDNLIPCRIPLTKRESFTNMQLEDLFARKCKAMNGTMGPPTALNVGVKADSSGQNGTPAMPKMGVRARVSEWPPKKDGSKEMCNKISWDSRAQSSYECIGSATTGGQSDQNDMMEKSLDLEFSGAKYSVGDIFCQSPQRGLYPIRQRSNSDVTISDIDADDVLDQNAVNPNTGAALHREYGSTSSIDRQGLSGENFFAMLRGYRVENMEHKNLAPFTFSDVFHCDPTVSPSLQAAAQISRGQFVRISGFDYMDGALLIGRDRDKLMKKRLRTDTFESPLFRKLRTVKSEHDALKFSFDLDEGRFEKGIHLWTCEKCFAHYDVQSMLFNVNEAMATRTNVAKRKNITTGASAASQSPTSGGQPGNCESPLGSKEDLDPKDNNETDEGDGKSNDIVLSCPYFRNEIGGEGDRRVALSRANSSSSTQVSESSSFESSLSSHCTNAGVSVLEVPRENQPVHREKVKRYIIEHIDLGAYYYRKYFYGKEHQNYFGIDDNLGPVAVSIRREKVDDVREKEGSSFNYRIAFRTSELTTLRGAVLEDSIPSTARHGSARGLPHKEILEYVIPELNIQCLRQAINTPKVSEQLLKLDEQGLSFQHKIGILYCKAGQSTEEEMYNNETAGPAFEEFLDLLGQRVRLKGFTKYRAQLDNKTDSTGTHSLYTTYKDYELMFHVSTMLPYMPSNRQQLLRKRHIGNDIVTIVFQEPGALSFTPKTIRSHFQHVFVIVKVHNPCTESVCYSVGVSRSKDVPPFGPPIPKGVTFPKSAVFRDFLLAKVINAENAAHKSEKFRAMATRTRQEYLKDLAENFVTTATVDSSVKFSFITLGAKRKERVKPKRDAHFLSTGAIVWNVIARDFGLSADIECLLGISNEFFILVEKESKNVVFNCSCRDVIGWTSGLMTIKIFYERGECVVLSSVDNCAEDIRDIVQRLEIVTRGCETTEMTLRRNGLGQLGFHVNFEGIVADVEPFGFAWKAGLRQGSRLVEICKVAVATLTHEQMIDLLRTSISVKVVIIQPHDDGSPRRGYSELCRMPMVEYKLDSEGTPCEYKTPFRRNTSWHRVQAPVGQLISCASPTLGASDRLPCQQFLQQSQAAIPRSTSFDRKISDGARSSPSNQSSSSDPGPNSSVQWRPHMGFEGCPSPLLHENQGLVSMECEAIRDTEENIEAMKHSEAQWHVSSAKIRSSYKERGLQKESSMKISPNKHSHIADKSCSSHSSSNTLSSNASSNSDEKPFGSGDIIDPELLGLTYIKGASTDSGIDTAPCSIPSQGIDQSHLLGRRSVTHSRTEQMLQWNNSSDVSMPGDGHANVYSVHNYSPSNAAEGSIGNLSELSSHSSGSHHSGSPLGRSSKPSGNLDSSKAYIVPHGQQTSGSVAKSFQRQGAVSKYVIGWKKSEDSPPPEENENAECHGFYSDGAKCASSNLQDSVMDAETESQNVLSKEDFLKMMMPDSPIGEEGRRKFSIFGNLSPRRSLCRTLSDESICSNRRGSSYGSSRSSLLDQALPNDILFSTTPPYHSTLPPRAHLNPGMGNLKSDCWFSDGSLSDKAKFHDPGLIPLPDTASGLDWSHLVNAARAFEGFDSEEEIEPVCHHTCFLDQRVGSFCTLNDMQREQEFKESQELPLCSESLGGKDFSDPVGENPPSTLTGKVNQLEVILRQLQTDLLKEKEDKAMLQAEVHHLRQHNIRLQEESHTASAQLQKFTEWFFNSVDKKA
ncbi:signal-induced proliferation-associated 1-like protein 2 isoform X2 [Spea bombifrons]|uniref:signal-induced proliferation-associated 1-like protein 2 isoform X2 n=1 Tax=Spea bombifrons TaxID=233779 RepID=UPI002349141A|nr:signal-induced proliferation-associated 1-like protein 2 isoform X2 [Spea bombifrons]